MIAPGLARSLTALMLLPGTAMGGAGLSTVALAALARPPRHSSSSSSRTRPSLRPTKRCRWCSARCSTCASSTSRWWSPTRTVSACAVSTPRTSGSRSTARRCRSTTSARSSAARWCTRAGGDRQGGAVAPTRSAGRHQLPGLHRRLLHHRARPRPRAGETRAAGGGAPARGPHGGGRLRRPGAHHADAAGPTRSACCRTLCARRARGRPPG